MCYVMQKTCNVTPETISHHLCMYVCMYLLLLGQPVSFMHCCDTVLFQRFMHLKACNGCGLNATYQGTILSTCFYRVSHSKE